MRGGEEEVEWGRQVSQTDGGNDKAGDSRLGQVGGTPAHAKVDQLRASSALTVGDVGQLGALALCVGRGDFAAMQTG